MNNLTKAFVLLGLILIAAMVFQPKVPVKEKIGTFDFPQTVAEERVSIKIDSTPTPTIAVAPKVAPTSTPVVTPTYWNDTRKESIGLPADGYMNPCCYNCTPACEFPWWCKR